ncbi:hypothetical protein [Pararhizobium haloflavum]|uniref:hypothetical protein n=1 Tax=Pararhizobium haloflavum TaxID=2037914 RepID=UPI001300134F|nr:hypothetical protein [Pararhizobium haloflavum]
MDLDSADTAGFRRILNFTTQITEEDRSFVIIMLAATLDAAVPDMMRTHGSVAEQQLDECRLKHHIA